MLPTTRFTAPASVDAWDRWFRWRDGDSLRDRTIDDTWWRVAEALAAVDGAQGRTWATRYVEAFSRWQLLPDERLLRRAGTDTGVRPFHSPTATLNVAAFVVAPLTRQARFDGERFAGIAALAVRLLDDALVMMHGPSATFADLRIGLIGLADALRLLGMTYDGTGAAELSRAVGKTLAVGTLQGSIELAGERGPIDDSPGQQVARWRDRGTPEALVEDALRRGVRHHRLTEITLQPRLALLSNNASDALDPASPHGFRGRDEASNDPDASSALGTDAMLAAQLTVRAAMQPWIDVPIDYPLVMSRTGTMSPIEYR